MNLDLPSATVMGFAGYALWETHRQYQLCAPEMSKLRNSDRHDPFCRQALLDSDVMVGSIVGLTALLAALVTKDWRAPLIMLAGFAVVSGLHHMVLRESTVEQVWGS